jgi:YbbR domain-containing protein
VTRVIGLIVHNWPLKLAAIGLAVLLYGGLVLSQSSRTFPGPIPVAPENQPDGTFLLTALEPVRLVRYLAPPSVQPIASTFRATVDLSGIQPGAGPQSAPIIVRAIDDRIQVVSSEPDVMTVQLDTVETRDVRVVVDHGTPPHGVEVGTTTVDPPTVKVTGPSSVVDTVQAAIASVVIQPDGISINQDVPVTAVDNLDNPVSPVRIDPVTVNVKVTVFTDRSSKTVPVNPVLTGTPAGGFEIGPVSAEPPAVTVEGNADTLGALVRIDTEPIPVTGLSSTLTIDVALSMPNGVSPLDSDTVQVVIALRPVTGTRSFDVGIQFVGADPTLAYATTTDRVHIVVGGSTADLDRLTGSALVAQLDVGDLVLGTTQVPVTADLPAGVTLVSTDPETLSVTVTAQPTPVPATPTPTPGSG